MLPTKSRSLPAAAVRRVAAVSALVLSSVIFVAVPAQAVVPLADIPLGVDDGPRAIEVTPDGSLIFVANEAADTVNVIDAATLTVVETIPVGNEPVDLAISPDGSVVYVVTFSGGEVNVIDVATLAVVGSPIAVGSIPTNVVFSPDGTKAYVSGYGSSSIRVITVATASVTTVTTPALFPQGLATSPDGSRLWFIAGSAVWFMDTTTLAIGPVFQPPLNPQIRYLALSPDGSRLAVGGDGTTNVYIADTSNDLIVNTIDVFDNAYELLYSADGSRLYVGLGGSNVAEVDPAAGYLGTITTGQATYGLANSPSGDFLYAANANTDTITILGDPVRRSAGANRFDTAIKASQQAFPAGAGVVFIATGLNYPDALAAGPAAAELGGPLLLTDPNALPQAVIDEINRLDPATIVIAGGTGAVSAAVQTALVPLATTVTRIAGDDRFETSRLISEYAFGAGGALTVYVATGRNFPDALSAGAVGASLGRPVILVEGGATSVDADTLTTLGFLGTNTILIAGGEGAVSAAIETQLSGAVLGTVTRQSGANRYDTSLAINADGFQTGAPRVLVATGLNFPDALAGSAWAGQIQAPLFIVPGTCIPQNILDQIASLDALQVTLIGGTGVLTQSVFDLTAC